jgi:hypothetical protein
MNPFLRLLILALLAPLVVLVPLGFAGGFALLLALSLYPSAVTAALLVLLVLHLAVPPRWAVQLAVALPLGPLSGAAAYFLRLAQSHGRLHVARRDLELYLVLGTALGAISWAFYRFGPWRRAHPRP